jgi:hypothetical protein
MWFILKLIVVVGAFLLRCLQKNLSWRSTTDEEKTVNNVDVTVSKKNSKHGVQNTYFKIPLTLPHFKLTRETKMDGIFKSLGFSEEYQTGDQNFDIRTYIACDHPVLNRFFRENLKSRVEIATLISHKCTSVSSDGKNLIVEFKGDVHVYTPILNTFTNLFLEFNKVDVKTYNRLKDPFTWQVLIIESGIYSLLIYGYMSFAQYYIQDEDIYLEGFPLAKQGIFAGLGIAFALIVIIFFILRGSSRGHRIILESIFVLGLAVPTSGIALISDINIELDTRPGEMVEAKLLSWFPKTHRRRNSTSTTYHMVIEPPVYVDSFNIPSELTISYDVYKSLHPNGKVVLEISKGYLKHPWIKSIKFVQP